MALPKTVTSLLAQHAVEYELVSHPSTESTRETGQAAHVPDDHIAKAVIVEDGQDPVMVVIPGSHWLKLESLDEELGRRFVLADEPTIVRIFHDCEPGAIPPLGSAYGLETCVDEQLTTLANIYIEAGDHAHLLHLKQDGFQKLIKGARHGLFSHAH